VYAPHRRRPGLSCFCTGGLLNGRAGERSGQFRQAPDLGRPLPGQPVFAPSVSKRLPVGLREARLMLSGDKIEEIGPEESC
jgi:hypothetical protein